MWNCLVLSFIIRTFGYRLFSMTRVVITAYKIPCYFDIAHVWINWKAGVAFNTHRLYTDYLIHKDKKNLFNILILFDLFIEWFVVVCSGL